jgi:hypothetical protein
MDVQHASDDDVTQERRTLLQVALDPGLLVAGAVLLMCASVLPGLSRVIVLPALVLAPGYAFLRLFGQPADRRAISMAVPVSLVLIACAALLLDASGVLLRPISLGLLLGGATAVFLAGSYIRQRMAGRTGLHRRPPPDDGDLIRRDAAVGDRRW